MSNHLFDPAAYTAQRKPLLEAATLPPECYTDDLFFEREIERIFLRNWQFVGREEQVAQAGQYFCYEGCGGSAIVVRARQSTQGLCQQLPASWLAPAARTWQLQANHLPVSQLELPARWGT